MNGILRQHRRAKRLKPLLKEASLQKNLPRLNERAEDGHSVHFIALTEKGAYAPFSMPKFVPSSYAKLDWCNGQFLPQASSWYLQILDPPFNLPLLAQFALKDFAGGVFGQFRQDVNLAGHLVSP